MSALLVELRHAVRSIFARPAFAGLVVLVLSVGLGCVLFVLSVINGVVLMPLPFADSERLYAVGKTNVENGVEATPGADLLDWRERLSGTAEVAGYQSTTVNLSGDQRPERVDGGLITANLWSLLGVQPAIGRSFSAQDDQPGNALTTILSDALWKSRYNADPNIVGRVIRANARSATVIGVMPPRFDFPFKDVLWLPAQIRRDVPREEIGQFDAVLRLAPGAGPSTVQATVDAWLADKARQQPDTYRNVKISVIPFGQHVIRPQTQALLDLMLGAVALVLLIACANAASLLLSQTLSRGRELAVRVALGAGRARLALHLLSQSMLLAAIACGLGLVFAHLADIWLLDVLANGGDSLPYWTSLGIDARLLALAVAVSALTGLLTGLLPALRVSSSAVPPVLRDGDRASSSRGFTRVSRWLVTGEVALSCVLLISTGMVLRGVLALNRFDLGFDTGHLLTARLALFEDAYPSGAAQVRLFERLIERLRAEPGIVAATTSSALPGFLSEAHAVQADGAGAGDQGYPTARFGATDDHFIETYGVTLQAGRYFDTRDAADGDRVAVVDTTFAERFWPNEPALGKRFTLDPDDKAAQHLTIVGVIAPLHLSQAIVARSPNVFVPLRQHPERHVSIAVRTRADPLAFAPRLSALMQEIDPDTPLYWVRSMDRVIELGNNGVAVVAQIFGAFGVIALLLAAAGLYGVIAFTVSNRTREIGVRRALGAPDARVLRNLLARSGWQVALGLAIGLALGMPAARLLAAQMSGAVAVEPSILLAALLTLLLSAMLAAWLPARRALAIDPVVALRNE